MALSHGFLAVAAVAAPPTPWSRRLFQASCFSIKRRQRPETDHVIVRLSVMFYYVDRHTHTQWLLICRKRECRLLETTTLNVTPSSRLQNLT